MCRIMIRSVRIASAFPVTFTHKSVGAGRTDVQFLSFS